MRYALLMINLTLLVGCQTNAPQEEYHMTSTIRDVMKSIVDPSANQLWDSVAVTVDADGVHESFPETDDDWDGVRSNAIALIESSNMLLIPDRQVAEVGASAEDPEVELQPAEVMELIATDRETWVGHINQFYDVAFRLLQQIDNRDVEGFGSSINNLDLACERCHLTYWYPNDEEARELYEENERLLLEEGGTPGGP